MRGPYLLFPTIDTFSSNSLLKWQKLVKGERLLSGKLYGISQQYRSAVDAPCHCKNILLPIVTLHNWAKPLETPIVNFCSVFFEGLR